ncbi:MAG: LptF/LptG family permease, partial [Bacteroidia bacterium]|nr:LptF/LptG family permease [Bacteroidia bacterium]
SFDKSQIIFSLASFDMDTTDRSLFAGHRIMKNINQLRYDIDSLQKVSRTQKDKTLETLRFSYRFHLREPDPGSKVDPNQQIRPVNNQIKAPQLTPLNPQMLNPKPDSQQVVNRALSKARNIRTITNSRSDQMAGVERQMREFVVEMYKKFTLSVACIMMFLIGAPLGAIIKKGGLGMPVLISIVFFILFYVISITTEKWVKDDVIPVLPGMWAANVTLFLVGLFFLRQARNDSRVFEVRFLLYLER